VRRAERRGPPSSRARYPLEQGSVTLVDLQASGYDGLVEKTKRKQHQLAEEDAQKKERDKEAPRLSLYPAAARSLVPVTVT
jgi:hypothetical protein